MSRWILIAATGLAMAGCQYLPFTGDKTGPEYKNARVLAPLDIPPDLVSDATRPGLTLPTPAPVTSVPASTTTPAEGMAAQPANVAAPVPDGSPTAPEPQASVVPASELQTQGNETILRVTMAPEKLWPVVIKTLQEQGYTVDRQDAATGRLRTAWKPERQGLSALLGSAVAANARSRYTVSMKSGENGAQLLSATREYQENNAAETGDVWEKAEPDKKAGASLLASIQKNLHQVTRAQVVKPTVERLEDAKGAYLVLSLSPEQAQVRVRGVLKGMGYELQPGNEADTFTLTRGEASDREGILKSIYTQLKNGILGAFRSDEEAGRTNLRLRLSPDAKSSGTVLEVLPEDSNAKKQGKAARKLVDQLAERLRKAS